MCRAPTATHSVSCRRVAITRQEQERVGVDGILAPGSSRGARPQPSLAASRAPTLAPRTIACEAWETPGTRGHPPFSGQSRQNEG